MGAIYSLSCMLVGLRLTLQKKMLIKLISFS